MQLSPPSTGAPVRFSGGFGVAVTAPLLAYTNSGTTATPAALNSLNDRFIASPPEPSALPQRGLVKNRGCPVGVPSMDTSIREFPSPTSGTVTWSW
jgi:hypothetical protein